jgi:predicted anti-sigma-YlaC factor YlaD
MMGDPRCEAARVWISAAADDEATAAERTALGAHLAECSDCRNWAALAGSLALRIRTAEPVLPLHAVEAPATAAPGVIPLRPHRARRLRGAAAAIAVSGVAAMVGVLVSSSTTTGNGPSAPRTSRQILVADRSPGFVDGIVGLDRTAPPRPVARDRLTPDEGAQRR